MTFRLTFVITLLEGLLLVLCLYPEWGKAIALMVFILSLIRFMMKIGNGSFFLELYYVYTCIVCILMPLVGYEYFPKENPMAALWVRYMPVSWETYFSFVLPAVLITALAFFVRGRSDGDGKKIVDNIVKGLRVDLMKVRPWTVMILVGASLISYTISEFLPDALKQVNSFLYFSLFAGMFYVVFYKGFPYKKLLIPIFIVFILFDAVRNSMFTTIAYMGGLFMILLLAGRQVRMAMKFLILFLAIVLFFYMQLFKLELRSARKKGIEPSSIELLSRVTTFAQHGKFDNLVFPFYYRMNQGFNIALVQRRIPAKVDYLGGEQLLTNFLSAFVPRLFWSDKPEAGGKLNMKIYTGLNIIFWSTNVGPIGEAYGSFGYIGGWIYLLALALFIRIAYMKYIDLCKRQPIFFIWLPTLFFQTIYVMETDSLQAFNSLIKGFVFIYIMYKLFPSIFPEHKEARFKINRSSLSAGTGKHFAKV